MAVRREKGGAHVRQASRAVTSVMYDLAMDPDFLNVFDDDFFGEQKMEEAKELESIEFKEIIKEGFLKKQGGFRGGFKTWKKRWFILKHDFISYYKNAGNINPTQSQSRVSFKKGASIEDKQLLGVLPLKGSQIIDVLDVGQKLSNDEKFMLYDPVQRDKVSVLTVDRPAAQKMYDNLKKGRAKTHGNLFGIKTIDRILWVYTKHKDAKRDWIKSLEYAITSHLNSVSSPASISFSQESRGADKQEKPGNWEIPFDALKFGEKIGDGNFGEVFSGKLWGTEVALKTLKLDQLKAEEIIEDLKNEVDILARLRHPNVVLYVGAATTFPDVCIVTEWCPNKSLYDLIYNRSKTINMQMILSIALDIAQGMNYLHSVDPPILHRDLKSHNILLDKKFSAKVADFGLSYKAESLDDTEGEVIGTPEWMAPEVMEGRHYNVKVDVYSFGIVLTELFSRIRPFSDQYKFYSYVDVFEAVLFEDAVPTIPSWVGSHLKKLIRRCLSRSPNNRPSFSSIISELRALSIRNENGGLFQKFDVPRILDMLTSRDAHVQALAAQEIYEIQKRNRVDFSCGMCGHSESNSLQNLQALDKKTVSIIVLRLAALFKSTEDFLILGSTKAFYEVLLAADDASLVQYRAMLREDGSLRRILVFMNSKTPEIKKWASRVMSRLTNGLEPEDQINFVDLSHSGLNALAAVSGGYRGLETLHRVTADDVDQLRMKRSELDEQIEKLEIFERTLAVSVNLLKSELETRKKEVMGKSTLKGRTAQRKKRSVTDRYKLFKSVRDNEFVKAAESFVQLDEKEVNPEDAKEMINYEVPVEGPVTKVFLKFFGDIHYFQSSCLSWFPDSEAWDFGYMFASKGKLHVYLTQEDDPQDARLVLNILFGMRAELGVWKGKPNCLILDHQYGTFRFCMRSYQMALDWARYLAPDSFADVEYSPSEKTFHSYQQARESMKLDEFTMWIRNAVSDRENPSILETSEELIEMEDLPSEFSVYYPNNVSAFGAVMISEGDSLEWVPMFAIVVNNEIRLFESLEVDPDEFDFVVYTPGSEFVHEDFITATGTVDSEWTSRLFALYDGAGVVFLCLKSKEQRDHWLRVVTTESH